MGLGGISVWQLVIILIVFLLTIVAAGIGGGNDKTATPDEADHDKERQLSSHPDGSASP